MNWENNIFTQPLHYEQDATQGQVKYNWIQFFFS